MKNKRILYLITGCILMLFMGLVYAWSLFTAPLEAELGWSSADTTLVFTITMATFCLGGAAAGFLLKKKPHRFVLRIVAVLIGVGFAIASVSKTPFLMCIGYGVLCGLGIGGGYNAILSGTLKWFDDKVGLASGILFTGFGFGSFLLGSLVTKIIEATSCSTAFWILAIVFFVIFLAGSFIVRAPQQNEQKVAHVAQDHDLAPGKVLRTSSFWFQMIWSILLAVMGLSIIGHAATIAGDMGAAPAVCVALTGVVSICNGLGRTLLGWMYDKFGSRVASFTDSIFGLVGILFGLIALGSSSVVMLGIGFACMGVAYGSIAPINSAYAAQAWGHTHHALNYAMLLFNLLPAAFLRLILMGNIFESSGYVTVMWILFVLVCVALVFGQLAKHAKRPGKKA